MNKKILIAVIILLIIISTVVASMFIFFRKPKIVETKTFNCLPGFIFKYPIFKGWEKQVTRKNNEDECVVWLNGDSFSRSLPRVRVKRGEGNLVFNVERISFPKAAAIKIQEYYQKIIGNFFYGSPYLAGQFERKGFWIDIYFYDIKEWQIVEALQKEITRTFKFLPDTKLVISKKKNGGLVEIGKIDFSNFTKGELVITNPGPEADKLNAVWEESKKAELSYHFEKKDWFKLVMYVRPVKPEDEDYKIGVYIYLKRNLGSENFSITTKGEPIETSAKADVK